MYYSMYIYTHTVGCCEKPGAADTQSTLSPPFIPACSPMTDSESLTNIS